LSRRWNAPRGSSPIHPRSVALAPPVFHEDWYSEAELARLAAAVQFVQHLPGTILELGCWEGRSTAVIANACHPAPLVAIDTWGGNVSEGPDHATVRLVRERDVYQVFLENMRRLTAGNVVPTRGDVLETLQGLTEPVRFAHIDAAHDYASVRETIQLLLPKLIPGGILFGHDYQTAHSGRDDLQGGVERAVREVLPRHVAVGNTWWFMQTAS
jgi:predicted O-methyltransferase YrrM